MEFQDTATFAREMDQRDPLRAFRKRYHVPTHGGNEVIYFTGNSLGLQPINVHEAVMSELDTWKSMGVEGHFRGKNPWFSYHEILAGPVAGIVGALPSEVVVMNQLTVNLHLLMISFYRPSGKRRKILFEHRPFPSDLYAFESQARIHGFDPSDVMVEMNPREGEWTLRTEDILGKIEEVGDELALVCFGGVNYTSGQFFDLKSITEAAHRQGAVCGFDLAHAAGNVPLELHAWNVDFACWCSYKYLNSGPGGVAGAFIHERHAMNRSLPRLAGWWGHDKNTRFKMEGPFDPIATAEGWQLSNAPILSMAAHRAALVHFQEAGMAALREKSELLTAYLGFVIDNVSQRTGRNLVIITPRDPGQRGAQLSIRIDGADRKIIDVLMNEGVIADWREPDILRVAPVPMYNSFEDISRFGEILTELLSMPASFDRP